MRSGSISSTFRNSISTRTRRESWWTPEGKVAQYFYGIKYRPEDLRLALVESSKEKIGSVVDQVLLFCCTYDPDTGKYHALIARVLAICGAITIVLVGGGLWFLFKMGDKQGRDAPAV